MKRISSRWRLCLAVVYAVFCRPSVVVAKAELASPAPEARAVAQSDDVARLSLAIQPSMVQVGELFSLRIAYHLIGQPDTSIFMDHPELVTYDPPLEMPCGFYTHPNRCTEITMRAVSSGVETFTAAAYGEIWYVFCECYSWSSALDDGAVSVVIVDQVWRVRLSTILR